LEKKQQLKHILNLATISTALSLVSLIYFSHLASHPGFGYSIFRFGFPFTWYSYGVIDLEGSFETATFLNAVGDIVLWSLIAFIALFSFDNIRTRRKISASEIEKRVRENPRRQSQAKRALM